MKKLTLLSGFAAGYVLGAKAGTQRYDQITAKVDQFMGKPQVRKATDTITQTAADLSGKAKDAVNDKVDSVAASVSSATPPKDEPVQAPIPGTAASFSAPDVALSSAEPDAATAPR